MSIPTILVIEDNLTDILILRHAFDAAGEPYQLDVLTDGEAALEFVAEHRSGAREPKPCIILLDLHLPKYNGLEVLAAIRNESPLSHIHVVVLTSSLAAPEQERHVADLGGVLRVKPTDLNATKQFACELLELCKGHATHPFCLRDT